MVTDEKVRILMKLRQTEKRYGIAAAKAAMDPKTAGKYIKLGKLASQFRVSCSQ